MGWVEVMRQVASLMRAGDLGTALSEVESFLSRETSPELRSDALGFSAHLKQQSGDLEGAEKDLLSARLLVGPTYGRYVQELGLGDICQKRQRVNEAVSWYRTALRTCAEGKGISGGTALKAFLMFRPQESLTAEEVELCSRVAERSWQVLGLAGRPDVRRLDNLVSIINDAQANPPGKPKAV